MRLLWESHQARPATLKYAVAPWRALTWVSALGSLTTQLLLNFAHQLRIVTCVSRARASILGRRDGGTVLRQ
jgi:hypothetical protein